MEKTHEEYEEVESKVAGVPQSVLDEMYERGKAHYDKDEYDIAQKVWREAADLGDRNSEIELEVLLNRIAASCIVVDGVLQSFSGPSFGTDFVVPRGVTCIADRAFQGHFELTSVTIPDGVSAIGEYAFCGCRGLTKIVVPNSVTTIGAGAFDGCISLTEIALPQGLREIGDSLFTGCTALKLAEIPQSVVSIGDFAFNGCSALCGITIPRHVNSIGEYAFCGCRSLTKINVTTMSINKVFEGCAKLKTIEFNGPKTVWKLLAARGELDLGIKKYTVVCTDGKIKVNEK